MNDHYIVSQEIIDRCITKDFRILEDGHNQSDHLPILMSISVPLTTPINTEKSTAAAPALKWSKLSAAEKQLYSSRLAHSLSSRPPSRGSNCLQGCHCKDETCLAAIQQDYDNLIACILEADSGLPRYRPGSEKDWWTSELTELKRQSIEIENVWIAEGRPHHGPISTERARVRAAYRRATRSAQRAPKLQAWNRLHVAMETNSTSNFWNSWRSLYSQNKSHFSPVVEGCSSKVAIAESFRNSFQSNSIPNNQTSVDSLNERFRATYADLYDNHSTNCQCHQYKISLENVIDAICGMKAGKCADEVGLQAEHFHHAPLNLIIELTNLFNSMMSHSFVPSQFKLGFMMPIVKDNQGNHADVSNYRGITISPISSKIFEHVLKALFSDFLINSTYQFGYKKKSSTVHALYCLRETIYYYVDNNSRVYCSFLDASKAFDRLVHSGLFLKLMERRVPKIFLDIIISWYDGMWCRVKWDDQWSDWFQITAGVRQGGVLSPDFYCLYVNELINILKSSGAGCYILDVFAAALIYADDMAVLAPSLKGLQRLLKHCEEYCNEWDILLNGKKSKNMCFGKGTTPLYKPKIAGSSIEWVDQWDYLGVTLQSGNNFSCSVDKTIRKFYRVANAILRVEGRSDDVVMLQLLETHCVSVLTYAIEVIKVTDQKRRQMRVAYNSIFRKLFNYTWRQSVTDLQHALGRPTWEELVERRQTNFLEKNKTIPRDSIVRHIASRNL